MKAFQHWIKDIIGNRSTESLGNRPFLSRLLKSQHLRFGAHERGLSDWDLVRMLPLRFSQRVFVNGFPGSGNVLLQNLCRGILEAGPLSAGAASGVGGMSFALGFLGPRYNRTFDLLKSALPAEWQGDCHFNPHRGSRALEFAAVQDPRNFLLVGPFDLGLHLNSAVHASHELPSAGSYEAYASLGLHVLPVVRHPLDTLASLAAKSHLTAVSERDTRALIDPVERKTRDSTEFRRAQAIRLGDKVWLTLAGKALREFYEPLTNLQNKWPVIRYEDTLSQPSGVVAALADLLEIRLDAAATSRVANIVGTKELAPRHFNQPGIAKWRRIFRPWQIAHLEQIGLFEIFAQFGYEIPTADEAAAHEEYDDQKPTERYASEEDPLSYFQYLGLAFAFDPRWLAAELGIEHLVIFRQQGDLRFLATEPELLAEFTKNLGQQVLKEACNPQPS